MPGPRTPGLVAAAALAVAQGHSTASIATKHGVSARTVQRWMKKPAFNARVEDLRNRMVDEAIGIMTAGATTAAAQLRVLAAKGTTEQVRFAASRALLADLLSVQSHAELKRELREIKQGLEAQAKRRERSKP
jgi:hypothetical protein